LGGDSYPTFFPSSSFAGKRPCFDGIRKGLELI
jgi:hypothetical protein